MNLTSCVLCLVVGLLFVHSASSAWSGHFDQRQVSYYVRTQYCAYGTWQYCCYWRYRLECKYRTEYFCKYGWRHNGDKNCSIPICSPACANGGECIGPYTCKCAAGYEGPICQGKTCVSHLKPCYPGQCVSNNCQCTTNFAGSTCLTFNSDQYTPTIDQCTTNFKEYDRVKEMMMFEYTVDATRSEKKEDIWVNQNSFNQIYFTFNIDFNYFAIRDSVRIPLQPGYIGDFRLGVVAANINVIHTRLPSQGGGDRILNANDTYSCTNITAKEDNPRHNEVQKCDIFEDNFRYSLQSGDRLFVTFSARSGGFRDLVNTDKPGVLYRKERYIGKDITKEMEFFFDFEDPVHCSEKSTCGNNESPFSVLEDVTKTEIRTSWSGWRDVLAGVARYAWEIFQLKPETHSKKLQEPDSLNPIINTGIRHNDSSKTFYYNYTPSDPGMYSIVLEIGDKANNTRYIRRLVLYDPNSDVTINSNHKLFVNSSHEETSYSWQSVIGNGNDGNTNVSVAWPNHFENKFHANNYLLNEVSEYSAKLGDEGRRPDYKKIDSKFDDNEGKRTTQKIPNFHGIVKFEIISKVDQNGGKTFTNIPQQGDSWENISPLAEDFLISVPNVKDGSTAKMFVKATDIMGNTKVDSTVVHFDTSAPQIPRGPEIQNNVDDGKFTFSSRVKVHGFDTDSGVYQLHWKLIMTSTNFTKMEGFAKNIKRTQSECRGTPCYSVKATGDNYFHHILFDINHCWMKVPKDELDTLVMDLEIDVINFAMLHNTTRLKISNIRELDGIEHYSGPTDIKITNRPETGVSLTWKHAASCYDRDVILIVVFMPDGTTKTLRADKDAERFDITGLEPDLSYRLQLITVYKDGTNTIDSTPSVFVVEKVDSGLSGGAIAGIVIGLLLILILIGIGILLWRTGRLERLLHRDKESSSIRNELQTVVVPKNTNNQHAKPNVYDNKAFNNRQSRSYEEDQVYYGSYDLQESYQIARKHVSLEEEIKRGKFAVIYKAQWYSDKPDPQIVVAKVLKDNATSQDTLAMKAKINFYVTEVGEHQHVLKFLGAVEDEHLGPFMLLEYCESGTLKDYLCSKQSHVTEDVLDKLFHFAFDICKGMEYLSGKGIVHRRLAARNILLNFLHSVKITGFGPMPNEEGQDDQNERLPIKWLPPECIEANSTRNATSKSDVWSYGIVLWEIFSMGDTPYPNVRGRDLLPYLKRGERMRKPENSDSKMYEIMQKSWRGDEKKRPSFKKLLGEIESLFVTSGDDECYYDSNAIYDNRK